MAVVVVLALAGCSDDAAEKPDAGTSSAAPHAVDIPAEADGVVQSVDAAAGTAVVTDWEGVDHIVPDAGLEDADFVTYDGHVARPVVMARGGTSAGKVAPIEGAEASSTQSGTVKWFYDERGYGFIERPGGVDLFFLQSSVLRGQTVSEGQNVLFSVVQGPKGLQAVNVELS